MTAETKIIFAGAGEELSCLRHQSGAWPSDPELTKQVWLEERRTIPDHDWVLLADLVEVPEGAKLCRALGKFWRAFGGEFSHIRLPKIFDPAQLQSQSEGLTFFGGSFDPWHAGHRECLEQCPEKDILVYPDANPQKSLKVSDCAWTRYLSVLQTVSDLPVSVYPGFCGLERPNPTIEWLEKISLKHKKMLMGDDQFYSIESWSRYTDLLQCLDRLYVVPRLYRREVISEKCQKLANEFPQLQMIQLNEHQHQDLASTKLR